MDCCYWMCFEVPGQDLFSIPLYATSQLRRMFPIFWQKLQMWEQYRNGDKTLLPTAICHLSICIYYNCKYQNWETGLSLSAFIAHCLKQRVYKKSYKKTYKYVFCPYMYVCPSKNCMNLSLMCMCRMTLYSQKSFETDGSI